MFNPSREDVRRFFCDAWHKHRSNAVLTPLEGVAIEWILRHPEYQTELEDAEAATRRDYRIEAGRTNPFLHLSMHLAIAEQLSIDQPPGIRTAYTKLVTRLGDEHAAAHEVMECLGEVVWTAQRSVPPLPSEEISARYLDCLERRSAG